MKYYVAVWEQVEFAQLGLKHEMCVAKQLKSAQRHSESDPTRTKCREGCASDISTHTAPQRERSDTHKVTRGLRGHLLDFHTTLGAPRKMSIENVKTYVLLRSQRLLCRCLQLTAPATKNEPGASKVLHLPHGIIMMPAYSRHSWIRFTTKLNLYRSLWENLVEILLKSSFISPKFHLPSGPGHWTTVGHQVCKISSHGADLLDPWGDFSARSGGRCCNRCNPPVLSLGSRELDWKNLGKSMENLLETMILAEINPPNDSSWTCSYHPILGSLGASASSWMVQGNVPLCTAWW